MIKQKLTELIEFIKTKALAKIDRKIFIYLVFVGISTIFWFLNKLNNEFNATVNYPVKYTNFPKNKVLVSDLPEELKLHISADGYTLLKYKLSPIPFPVVINLNHYAQQITPEKVSRFTLQTRFIKSNINQQLGKEITLYDILPDTISFRFANIVNRKIALAANTEIEFAPQCMLNGPIKFTPDSIVASGPEYILDTLKFIYNKKQKFKGIDKPIQRNVSLKDIDKLSFAKKRVVMNVPVSKFTEVNVEVPIQVQNIPDTLQLITFPQQVKITCLAALSDVEKISANNFNVQVDYNEIEQLLGQRLSVKMTYHDELAHSVSFSPAFVEFIIEKRHD